MLLLSSEDVPLNSAILDQRPRRAERVQDPPMNDGPSSIEAQGTCARRGQISLCQGKPSISDCLTLNEGLEEHRTLFLLKSRRQDPA